MDLEFNLVWFGFSFLIYSLLRFPDEYTTRNLASRGVALDRHEVNPTITWLAKKTGLDRALRLTWIVIGIGVASADTYLEQNLILFLPLFALILGFAHVLAAANNTQVNYLLDKLGADEFEREHDKAMRELAKLSWRGRIGLLFRSNTEAFLMTILAIPISIALGCSLVASTYFIVLLTPLKLLIVPVTAALAFTLALLLFYPAKILGPILLAIRLSKQPQSDEDSPSAKRPMASIELPFSLVERALSEARVQGSDAVRITVQVERRPEQ